jgi:hypothetical protein
MKRRPVSAAERASNIRRSARALRMFGFLISFIFVLTLGLTVYGLSYGRFFFPDIITLTAYAGIALYCFKFAKKLKSHLEIES